MSPSLRGNRVLASVLLLLAMAVTALALLQYRWIDRITESERKSRLGAAELVARRVADGFRRELQEVFSAFAYPDDKVMLYEEWAAAARWPALVSAVYVAQHDEYLETWSLYRVDPRQRTLVPAEWTPDLAPLRPQLDTLGLQLEDRPPPLAASIPAIFIAPPPPRDLFHPLPAEAVLVLLDAETIRNSILPTLLRNEASAGGVPLYDISLVTPARVLYSSTAEWPGRTRAADAAVVVSPFLRRQGPRPPPRELQEKIPADHWSVLVRQRGGGVDELVSATRRRNLAVMAAILLTLIASVATLVQLIRRGERMRSQQATFVRVMTHELNTPVSVLRAAGENLKDGIVAADQVPLYGATVVEEADRLHTMLHEVLDLARLQSGTGRASHRLLAIGAIVHAAVERCRLPAGNRGVELAAGVPRDLPPVKGDDQALTRALENLIVNAIRHGGAGKWVGVEVRRETKKIAITVADRGPGIAEEDLAHVFEPFYRSRDSEQVPGAGLGLAIVKQVALDHGGSVTVENRRPGAAFTFCLPAEGADA
ncbi:MAG TPA: HAMP domain-containing sensor histidine kinase [Thermoanaerobaculia bacterium]|nr:HAMP domain-containing sensor histidine kinase [Thermoanaerobaculia bacterium]